MTEAFSFIQTRHVIAVIKLKCLVTSQQGSLIAFQLNQHRCSFSMKPGAAGIDRQGTIKDRQRLFIFMLAPIEIHAAHPLIGIEVEGIKAKASFECLKSILLTV